MARRAAPKCCHPPRLRRWRGKAVPGPGDEVVIAKDDVITFDRNDDGKITCKKLFLDPRGKLTFKTGGKRILCVDGQVESRIEDGERSRIEERLRELLTPLLQSLPAQDRLLLKLYYWDGLSMAAIAPLLGCPQRELYSVRDKCLKKLRLNLEDAGLRPDQVSRLPGYSHLDLVPDGI